MLVFASFLLPRVSWMGHLSGIVTGVLVGGACLNGIIPNGRVFRNADEFKLLRWVKEMNCGYVETEIDWVGFTEEEGGALAGQIRWLASAGAGCLKRAALAIVEAAKSVLGRPGRTQVQTRARGTDVEMGAELLSAAANPVRDAAERRAAEALPLMNQDD